MRNAEKNQDIPIPDLIDSVTRIDVGRQRSEGSTAPPNKLLSFIEELRRRKVCRALTMYTVTLWLVSQVVDLLYQQLGLPDWTLRFVVMAGLAGLPIALLLSWLLDLSPNGLVFETPAVSNGGGAKQNLPSPVDRLLDGALLTAALGIVAYLGHAAIGPPGESMADRYVRIAVAQFSAGPGPSARALAESLTTELQHALATQERLQVIAPRDPFDANDCVTLTGSITADDGFIRITLALVDADTSEVIWSDVIHKDRTDAPMTTADIARDIVSILQLPA
ncbi:MAG: hypothetical protein AAGA61_10805, partial [Pseudomonadota bacterium]